ncbi:MAG TPA: hypothetical protein VKB51_10020 [bacterium]|nr:hypothetical protein [bacterium]
MKSSTWFLIFAAALIAYVIFQGGERRFAGQAQSLNYDVVAVSNGMTAQAQQLNLQKDLDVSLLPEIGKQAIRDAAQQGLKQQAFLEAVLREVSDRVHDISTIDLNGDGTADPILVRPEPGGSEGYVLLSLEVPAPGAYPLPAAGDAEAWKKVDKIEVATMTISLNKQQLAVQATGNQYAYPDSYQQHYYAYDRSPSFLQTYFAIRMLDWMFFPHYWGFWGPGWGYGYYRPMSVPTVLNRRGTTINNYGYRPATSSRTPVVRSRSGSAPLSRYQRAYSSRPPRALSDLQASRRFARRSPGSTVRSGGFGRGTGSAARAARASRYSGASRAARGFGGYSRGTSRGFGRSFGRSFGRRFSSRGFGGFGRRGFGGFGRGFRFRR